MTDEFRHRTRVEVRFRDLDALDHVNNAVIATYVEQARVTYLREVLHVDSLGEMGASGHAAGASPILRPWILAMLKIDYETPILFGEAVEIETRVDWIGRTSVGMTHRLSGGAPVRVMAHAEAVLVGYDYEQHRPQPVPDATRRLLEAHEGHALARKAVAG